MEHWRGQDGVGYYWTASALRGLPLILVRLVLHMGKGWLSRRPDILQE